MNATQADLKPKAMFTRIKDGARVRVMTVAEGHVMARIPGCIPWVMHWKDFLAKHTKMENP